MIIHDPTIAERYAQAFFRTAKRQGKLNDVLQQVESLLPSFAMGTKYRIFLEAPQVTTEDKERLLQKTMEGNVEKLIYDLLSLLLRKGRIEYVQPVLDRFKIIVERDQGIYAAEVATAKPLADTEKQTLQRALETYTSSKLKLNYLVKPELIAGVRFSYGDTLIDDTVRGKLYKLRQQLETAAKA